nr:hypothetical protein [Leifsonia sp. Leaf325]
MNTRTRTTGAAVAALLTDAAIGAVVAPATITAIGTGTSVTVGAGKKMP